MLQVKKEFRTNGVTLSIKTGPKNGNNNDNNT